MRAGAVQHVPAQRMALGQVRVVEIIGGVVRHAEFLDHARIGIHPVEWLTVALLPRAQHQTGRFEHGHFSFYTHRGHENLYAVRRRFAGRNRISTRLSRASAMRFSMDNECPS